MSVRTCSLCLSRSPGAVGTLQTNSSYFKEKNTWNVALSMVTHAFNSSSEFLGLTFLS